MLHRGLFFITSTMFPSLKKKKKKEKEMSISKDTTKIECIYYCFL